eukprot:CAMPEP_0185754598 /NCGR_PEP_ID=MMETSP1174-20130828/13225_1 /TAXON_ID=35687 /ORGANISM="Dictyocha speculum, Strain CCMP1381" /LENGTH=447 /DNA_ID=CAMNT_0028432879 /DNA_START=77 /DNA_END=1420 /DNA_ORIENTATION=+
MEEGGVPMAEYMLRRRNITLEQYNAPEYPLNLAAKELMFDYAQERHVINPRLPHLAVSAARKSSAAAAVYEDLALRYFEHGQDISSLRVIRDVFRSTGLLASDSLAELEDVLRGEEEEVMRNHGELDALLSSVPHFLIRDRVTGSGLELNGALSVEEFASYLARVRAAEPLCTRYPCSPDSHGLFQPPGMMVAGFAGKPIRVLEVDRLASATLITVNMGPWVVTKVSPKENDVARQDETPDSMQYATPNFVTHVDAAALAALTGAYRSFFLSALSAYPSLPLAILDTCSSWVSHYPTDAIVGARITVHGLNQLELDANSQATERVVGDLNVDPHLPFKDDSFHFVTNVAGLAYLIHPRAVIAEMHRVLKPGGVAIVAFSNRVHASKAVASWLSHIDEDVALCNLVKNHFGLSNPRGGGGGWDHIGSVDISPHHSAGDPMWLVTAVRK